MSFEIAISNIESIKYALTIVGMLLISLGTILVGWGIFNIPFDSYLKYITRVAGIIFVAVGIFLPIVIIMQATGLIIIKVI